MRSRLVYCLEI